MHSCSGMKGTGAHTHSERDSEERSNPRQARSRWTVLTGKDAGLFPDEGPADTAIPLLHQSTCCFAV